MNKIQKELKSAKEKYSFIMLEENKKLVKPCFENVALVEAMIDYNSDYNKQGNPNIPGSLADLMIQFRETDSNDKKKLLGIIQEAVKTVNKTNHTRMSGKDQSVIVRRINGFGKENVEKSLKNSDLDLYNEIARRTEKPEGSGKRNTVFASKFCHYACLWFFEGKKEADNYSIMDSVVKEILPEYAKAYEIECDEKKLDDYQYYRSIVDKIIKASGSKISRNGFDHLLWYCNK